MLGLSGSNTTVDQFFIDGSIVPSTGIFGIELDPRLVPQLDTLDAVLSGLFGSFGETPAATSTLGLVQYDVLFEKTNAPISVAFGATKWLAVFTVVPIVRGQSFVGTEVDSMTAEAGPVGSAFGGDADGFFTGLDNGIAGLESTCRCADAGSGALATA
jgi:hypothetical protein